MSARTHAQIKPAAAAFTPAKAGVLQRKCACGGLAGLTEKCDECDRQSLTLQRHATGPATPNVPPIVNEVLGSAGQPLDFSTRAFIESRLGHNFSQVRVHTDARAVASARAVNALAYTVGQDIVFAAGQYAPETMSGKRLLAHEMTHVLQQSASAGPPQIQFGGRASDQYEMEADAVAAQVTRTTAQPHAPSIVAHVVSPAPVSLMRNVAPPQAPKTCDEPKGPGVMPKEVGQTLIDRMMGKFAKKDKDPGEGCREQPYVAGIPESVCTIGFGHQITEMPCPVLRKDNGQQLTAKEKETKKFQVGVQTGTDQPPSAEEKKESKSDQPPGVEEKKETATSQPPASEEKKEGEVKTDQPTAAGKKKVQETKGKKKDPNEITIAHLKCGCEGQLSYKCKGSEAEDKLRRDANIGASYVRKVVPVDLTQEQFDALVDITLHVGHIPDELLDAIKQYWCTAKGQNYVRSVYLRTALTREHSKTIEEGFVKRREYRVWPLMSEMPVVAEKKADPPKKVEDKPKPPSNRSLTFLPAPEAPLPSLLPGAPGDSPVAQAAQAVKGAEDWARQLLHKGAALRNRLASNRPTEAELKAFADEEALWRSAVETAKSKYKHSEETVNSLGALLDRVGPKLTQLRVHLGVS